jgi:ABC-type transport system involved in multi-copper enzyme maturation permease subunit
MTLPNFLYALRWLIRDTFRQAIASGMMVVMLTVTGVCILFCASVSIEGGKKPVVGPNEHIPYVPAGSPESERLKHVSPTNVVVSGDGVLSFAFGAIRIPFPGFGDEMLHYIELLLAGAVADTFGILLALIWTAGFLPTFLEPSVSAVLLSKPLPRWALLVGKYVAVMTFVLFQAVVFVAGTWLALSVRTGIWDTSYLVTIPMLLLHFGIFFSFSLFLAVLTRSTVVCVVGSLLFWLLCWGMNYGRLAVMSFMPTLVDTSPFAFWMTEVGYWFLPKPYDFGYLLFRGLNAQGHFPQAFDFNYLENKAEVFYPVMSIFSSMLFTVAVLAVGAYEFITTDY